MFVIRERDIYSAISKLKLNQSGSYYSGVCWYPAQAQIELTQIIRDISQQIDGSSINIEQIPFKKKTPPTLFRTNEFLDEFQGVINIYGTPSYKEINPLVIFVISFPFFFGLMFGDVCHGIVIIALSIYLMISEPIAKKVKEKNFVKDLVSFRYVLLLMGISSLICGVIYDEYGSLPVVWKGSCYEYKQGMLNYIKKLNCDYGIGIDFAWYVK
jgi:V-type H+-transporting ATPase subunit a